MISQPKPEDLPKDRAGFSLRGLEVTRLDTFIDAAFAFALTLLVISFDTLPGNIEELLSALKGTPGFAASFAQIMLFWVAHRTWSRRFGLEDTPAVLISLLFIFLIMVFVYPLRMMFGGLFHWISNGWLTTGFEIGSYDDLRALFIIFGLGFMVMCGLVAALNRHACRQAHRLRLSPEEIFLTRAEYGAWLILTSCGAVSALLAGVLPDRLVMYASFIYWFLVIIMPMYGVRLNRQRKKKFGLPEFVDTRQAPDQ
ncbi:hypothetical protein MnTg04_00960 [bacterium MnTg04]|nr:hypothetical protein MnTg04_00960 [bacterium MnTg04]